MLQGKQLLQLSQTTTQPSLYCCHRAPGLKCDFMAGHPVAIGHQDDATLFSAQMFKTGSQATTVVVAGKVRKRIVATLDIQCLRAIKQRCSRRFTSDNIKGAISGDG